MDKIIQIKNTKLPRMLSELMHSNQFLKTFAVLALGMAAIISVALVIIVSKPPMVLTLTPKATVLEAIELPKPEEEITAAIKTYLEARYNWEPANVAVKLKSTENFILPQSVKAFQSAITNVIKFSTEKLVSQKTYSDGVKVNLNQKTVFITGDRITSIQGMKAVGNLRLELSFESGPRTKLNPWGIYITKEREEQ